MSNILKSSNSKLFKILFFLFFYFSILIGFYFDENITIGPKIDFINHLKTLNAFDLDLKYALLNYHTIDYPTRISPVFLLYLYCLKNIFSNIDFLRFISMNIYLISPFIFYNCLKLKFRSINKNILFYFSFLLYLSPSFRGNTIWPESSMLALIFFISSIYFYLKFENDKKLSFVILNIIFLSIAAYRKLSKVCDYPLHLGITEAGSFVSGSIKSSIGLGSLLMDGIGDTIRISLSDDPVQEVRIGNEILKSLNLRNRGVKIISCPSCARQAFPVINTVKILEDKLSHIKTPVTLSVIGCVVNGPGEAALTDIGITGGGKGSNMLYLSGIQSEKILTENIISEVVNQVEKKVKEIEKNN